MPQPKEQKYDDLPLSNFPVHEDNWARMNDVTPNLVAAIEEYEYLLKSGDILGANALIENNIDLKKTIFNADKWNKLRDGIISLQRFFFEDVDKMVEHVAQQTVGINDSPSEEDKATNAYSALKVDELFHTVLTDCTKVIPITLPSSGWTGTSAPFTQTVTVEGISSNDKPIIGLNQQTADLNSSKNVEKNFSFIYTADTGDGTITFYARKKPGVNIPLSIKGK
ncbi:hypothetical protein AALB16_10705 [Lachnospiraceae bacterium 62-35]